MRAVCPLVLILCVLVLARKETEEITDEEVTTGYYITEKLENAGEPFFDVIPEDLAKRQQDVNRLLWRIYEPLPRAFKPRTSYDPMEDMSLLNDEGMAVRRLMTEFKNNRMLPRRHVFSIFNERHVFNMKNTFEALMSYKDWKSAVEFAAHVRDNMNEMMFVNAFCIFILQSGLGKNIVLPPLYEIYPQMFVNTEVILEAYKAKMTNLSVNIPMKYTGTKENKEQRVAYFTEDVGMNNHHTTWHMDFPFWWDDKYGYHFDRKGELFFWAHNQHVARYDNERLSNGLDMIKELHWDKPIEEGFTPHVIYKYGGEIPSRPDNWQLQDVDEITTVNQLVSWENRIREAIERGFVFKDENANIEIRNDQGIDILGDIIESSKYSPNLQYYGDLHNLAHIMIASQSDPQGKFNRPAGAMENSETSPRDPVFFRLHKRLDNIFKELKWTLPPYSHEDLDFPEVKIESVGVEGELVTFFEPYEIDLRNAVDYGDDPSEIKITATVDRLNHHNFSWVADVSNAKDSNVIGAFRIYLCPDYDNNGEMFTLQNGHWHCIEMDKFWETLAPGQNHIVRNSKDSSVTVPDVPSFQTLIDAANTGHFYMPEFAGRCGIPERMLLPKGKKDGMEYTLMLAVTNDTPNIDHTRTPSGIWGAHALCPLQKHKHNDKRPMGFPLDRQITQPEVFYQTTNIRFTSVLVYHHERLH